MLNSAVMSRVFDPVEVVESPESAGLSVIRVSLVFFLLPKTKHEIEIRSFLPKNDFSKRKNRSQGKCNRSAVPNLFCSRTPKQKKRKLAYPQVSYEKAF